MTEQNQMGITLTDTPGSLTKADLDNIAGMVADVSANTVKEEFAKSGVTQYMNSLKKAEQEEADKAEMQKFASFVKSEVVEPLTKSFNERLEVIEKAVTVQKGTDTNVDQVNSTSVPNSQNDEDENNVVKKTDTTVNNEVMKGKGAEENDEEEEDQDMKKADRSDDMDKDDEKDTSTTSEDDEESTDDFLSKITSKASLEDLKKAADILTTRISNVQKANQSEVASGAENSSINSQTGVANNGSPAVQKAIGDNHVNAFRDLVDNGIRPEQAPKVTA